MTLKTQNDVLKRPVNKLCPLEHQDKEEEVTHKDNTQAETAYMNMTRCRPRVKEQPPMIWRQAAEKRNSIKICGFVPTLGVWCDGR